MFELTRLANSELFRYRAMLINGVFIYPLFWILVRFYQPETPDSVLISISLSCMLLGCFVWSFYAKKKIKFLERAIVWGGFSLVLHSNLALIESNAHPMQYCGYIILISTLINIFPTKKSSIIVGFSAALFSVGMLTLKHPWILPEFFIPFGVISAVLPAFFANFTRLNHLSSLAKVEKQQSVLFNSLSEGLIVYGEDGKTEATNPAAHKILGLQWGDEIDLKSSDAKLKFIDPSGAPLTPEELPSSIASQRKKPVKNHLIGVQTAEGEIRWLNVNAIPYHLQEQGMKVAVTFADITEMKKSQDVISQQQSQLVASSKMSALGEMAAGVAHEINNPLAIISGKVFQVRRDLKAEDQSKVPEHLDKISATILRIQKIIKGLQTFARGGEHDPFFQVSMKSLIEEVLSFSNERIIKQNIQVDVQIADDIKIECRTAQISQVILNLIHNSCDAVSKEKERWIRIESKVWGQRVQILISDSGSGISPEIQAKIMQPFFTTKEVGEGTGLGLSISKGIIDSHQGRFELMKTSNPTTFLIDLPLLQSQQNPPRTRAV